jgi:hypothetical protein
MNERSLRCWSRGWSGYRGPGLAMACLAVLGTACGNEENLINPEVGTTQTAIKAALGGVKTDVEQMRFELHECPSADNPDADNDGLPDGAPLQDLISPMGPGFLPDGLATFQNKPADASSAHPFSDGLFVVRAGVCYVVRSTPLKQDKSPSKDCYPATKQIGAVPAGKTKEVVIINQCKGDPKGIADVVALLNHPPELVHLTFENDGKPATKFMEDCPDETLRVCAKVLDPDNDPIEWFLFQVNEHGQFVNPPTVTRKVAPGYPKPANDGISVNCWDVSAPGPGSYNLLLVARDQMWDNVTDPANPKLISIEELIGDTQHEKRLSRAVQSFPLHVVPCQSCEKGGVDVVFTMDTSGSMTDDGAALCNSIAQVQAELMMEGIVAHTRLWGITNQGGAQFSCLTDTVLATLGPAVPGNAGSCGPTLDHEESWGQSTAIVAERYPWTPGAVRVIVPLSDEESCRGIPCEDPGADRDSITNAIDRAKTNKVIVSPITAQGASACVTTLAGDLASGTGGLTFQSTDPALDIAGYIKTLIKNACRK